MAAGQLQGRDRPGGLAVGETKRRTDLKEEGTPGWPPEQTAVIFH